MSLYDKLSRRERQIMDILLELGEGTAEEVRRRLPDPPSYSAVRAMLAKLEAKGPIQHKERGPRYVYSATISRRAERRSAMKRLVNVFYGRSLADALTGMLDLSADQLSDEDLERLTAKIEAAKKKRRSG
jgi:predicted transcriptional regulator